MSCGCEEIEKYLEREWETPRVGRPGTPRLWRLHLRGEELHVFPTLRVFFPNEVERLLRDHALFHREISRYGEIRSIPLLREHARLEDRLFLALAETGYFTVTRDSVPNPGPGSSVSLRSRTPSEPGLGSSVPLRSRSFFDLRRPL